MIRSLFITVAFTLAALFALPSAVLAADDNTPCPEISGIQTFMTVAGAKCNFPSGSFPIGSASGNAAQQQLDAWNIQHRTTSQSGVTSGTQGATPIQGAGEIPASSAGSGGGPANDCASVVPGVETLCKAIKSLTDAIGQIGIGTVWWILALVARLFFWGGQLLLWISTSLLDLVVYLLVLNMGVFINNTGANGIREAWEIIRDLTNILIIGGFIAVGISTILQVEQYSANKFLSRLIIAALLVNFSYFIAGAVIDASNFVATTVYTSNVMQDACDKEHPIVLPDGMKYSSSAGGYGSVSGRRVFSDTYLCSYSQHIAATIGIGTWANVKAIAGEDGFNYIGTIDTNRKLAVIGLLGGLFMVVTGFVFFSAAILLLGRFVVLILLLVTSPIGVAGTNIPYIDQYAGRWWSALIGQALFAPVYFILVALSLKIIKGLLSILGTPGASEGGFANIASGSFQDAANAIPMFITFFIAMAFMYASLAAAKSMSESGKEFFGQIYGALDKKLGGIYGNLYQMTARNALRTPGTIYDLTVGQLPKLVNKIPIVGGVAGNLLGGVTGGVGQMLRVDNTGKPFGASSSVEERTKGLQEYNKSLIPVEKAPQMLRQAGQGISDWWNGKTINDVLDRVTELSKKDPNTLTAAEKLELEKGEKKLRGAAATITDDELKAMSTKDLQKWAPHLSSAQMATALGRGDLTEKQQSDLTNARFSKLTAARERGDDKEVTRLLGDMDEMDHKLYLSEREEARSDQKLLAMMSRKHFEAVTADRTIFSAEQSEKARGDRKEGIKTIMQTGTDDDIKTLFKRMSEDEQKELDINVAATEKVINNMTITQLRLRYHEGTDEDRKRMDTVLESPGSKFKKEDVQYIRPNYRATEPKAPAQPAPPAPAQPVAPQGGQKTASAGDQPRVKPPDENIGRINL